MHALIDALLASAQDATWVVDRDLCLTHSNDAFSRLVERSLGVASRVGMSLDELIDPDRHIRAHDFWLDLFRRALSGRNVASDNRVIVDGMQRVYAVTGVPVIEQGSITAAAFTARDITDQAGHARDDLFELSLTRLFVETDKPLDETMTDALEYLCESDNWDCAVLWFLEGGERELAAAALYGREELRGVGEFRRSIASLRFARGHGLPGRAWATDDIVWVSDLFDETNIVRGEVAAQMGLHGAVAVPIHDGTHVTGVLELFARTVRPPRAAHLRALQRIGSGLGRLVARRRVEDERRHLQHIIERKSKEWTLTFDAIELPIFITSMDGVIRRLNRGARDLAGRVDYSDVLGCRVGTLGLIDD